MYRAQARISLEDADAVLDPVCQHMTEHGGETRRDAGARILEFPLAKARFAQSAGETVVDVEAATLEALYFVRLAIASHVVEFARAPVPPFAWTGDGEQIVRPLNFQMFEVQSIRDVTPRMRRLVFQAEDVTRFVSLDALHLNLLLQHPDLASPQWPEVGMNGLIRWREPERRPHYRKYTVRSLDPLAGTLAIDFVLHDDHGPGSGFAINASPGDKVGVVGPGGGGLRPADWYLFAGDETALPAIARMLESLPATAEGVALIEVEDRNEIQHIDVRARISLQWLTRDGRPSGLAESVRSVEMPAAKAIYLWAGCEFEGFKAIRAHARDGLKLGKDRHLVVSYWRKGTTQDD